MNDRQRRAMYAKHDDRLKKQLGWQDPDTSDEIKHTEIQLRMSQGQPLRQEYLRQKLEKLKRSK